MLLRLATHTMHGLQVRIRVSSNFKCPFFVFQHCDNQGHSLVGGWHGDTLTLPKLRDGQCFTSLLHLFRFLAQAHATPLSIPRNWALAFCWTPHNEWNVGQIQPFSTFLQRHKCYVHDEPPYQLYFTDSGPKLSAPPTSFEHQFALPNLDPPHQVQSEPAKKTMSFKQLCRDSWGINTPIPVYTNSNSKMNRQIWKRFLTRHQILNQKNSSTLFDLRPSPTTIDQAPQLPSD